jgi:hypothetical protein
VIAAVALAVTVVGSRSCAVTDPGPEGAVRNMLAAASAGDRVAVYALLGPQTRARLDERARRATDVVGSSVRYSALDLISIGASRDVPPPTDLTVVERLDERAVVEVVSAAGRARVVVVRVDGDWRIELPEYGAD